MIFQKNVSKSLDFFSKSPLHIIGKLLLHSKMHFGPDLDIEGDEPFSLESSYFPRDAPGVYYLMFYTFPTKNCSKNALVRKEC